MDTTAFREAGPRKPLLAADFTLRPAVADAAAQIAGISRGHAHRRLNELGLDAETARQARRQGEL